MTIKRRLSISNILMFVIPVILCGVLALVARFIIIESLGFGSWQAENLDSDRFYVVKHELDSKLAASNLSFDSLCYEIDSVADKYSNEKLSFALVNPIDGSTVYGEYPSMPINISDADLETSHIFIMDTTAVYILPTGEFALVFVDAGYVQFDMNAYRGYLFVVIAVSIAVILLAILITNRILTTRLWKPIIGSLTVLSEGVTQIRDEHLGYRIQYDHEDEFKPVCDDFNEMAKRLESMMLERHKDAESRKELIAGISHDLRTPLTSIKAYIEGIEKGVASTPELQNKYIATIKSKADDLEHIIEQLFLFSKLDVDEFALHLESVEINSAIASVVDEHSDGFLSKGLAVEYRSSIPSSYIKADAVWLRNVLMNIFENSAKYKTAALGHLKVLLDGNKDHITITLTDDGLGVPEQSLLRLFDVFYRSDPSRNSKGSGLGLAISSKVIEKMGGTIVASNASTGGLTITITLAALAETEA